MIAHGFRKPAIVIGPVVALSLLLGSAAPAAADTEVVRSGHCTGTATWRMEVEKDDGVLEFELKINGTQAYKTWRVKIWQNGSRFYAHDRVANRYGNFEIERDRPNRYGTDTFHFHATQLSNGQFCTGTLRI